MSLQGKKIILAVTGSIAAYKTPQLVRLLIKAGAEVKVIMTPAAAQFVTPLALSTVSRHPVMDNVSEGSAWNNHVELGLWADALLVAPCSANTLAKLAHGICDTLVNAVYLSARCPVFVAPAMDEDMWLHPSTRNNIATLKTYGNHIIPVAHGELASGLVGPGRMAEPEDLVAFLQQSFNRQQPYKGRKVLVTAGPTYERLDPVRFIGNFSTGKMGIAIADTLAGQGAEVTLVLGPSSLLPTHPDVTIQHVESARQMYDACLAAFPVVDIAIMAAAVADYRPEHRADEKIKKSDSTLSLSLVKNPDILAALGGIKTGRQFLAGFALETTNEQSNALKKLQAKNADIIVLNSLKDEGAGFAHDTNKVTILHRNGEHITLPLQSKKDVAAAIVHYIAEQYEAPQDI